MKQPTELDFLEARLGGYDARENLVKSVNLGELGEIISEVKYIPQRLYLKFGTKKTEVMMTHLGTWQGSIITVYPASFTHESVTSIGDYLSLKIDHEGQHAIQSYHGMLKRVHNTPKKEIRRNYYETMLIEIPAYANQLANAKKRGLRKPRRKITEDRVSKYVKQLKILSQALNLDWKNDLESVLCNTPGDKWVRKKILK